MDLVVANARVFGREGGPADIGIAGGRIVAIEPRLEAAAARLDAGGRLVSAGLVETHIHLDKTRIIDRCAVSEGTVQEAVALSRR